MLASRSSDRANLSTELGYAVVGGIALVYTAPGRVGRQVTGVAGAVSSVAESWTSRLVGLAGRRR